MQRFSRLLSTGDDVLGFAQQEVIVVHGLCLCSKDFPFPAASGFGSLCHI